MRRWKITVETWPYSLPNMTKADAQKLAGTRSADYEVLADCAKSALRMADAIVMGVKANPAVWNAPIVALVQMPEG